MKYHNRYCNKLPNSSFSEEFADPTSENTVGSVHMSTLYGISSPIKNCFPQPQNTYWTGPHQITNSYGRIKG